MNYVVRIPLRTWNSSMFHARLPTSSVKTYLAYLTNINVTRGMIVLKARMNQTVPMYAGYEELQN